MTILDPTPRLDKDKISIGDVLPVIIDSIRYEATVTEIRYSQGVIIGFQGYIDELGRNETIRPSQLTDSWITANTI